MAKLFNRAKMTTSTTGSGTVTLSAAAVGFQSFADAGVSNGDVVQYLIEEGAAWEIGTGTYSSTGTSLTRTPSESSDGGTAITLGGAASVAITAVADDLNRLQHEGSTKVSVSATGASVTGALTTSGDLTVNGEVAADLSFGDSTKAKFGAGDDLQIYHDGSNSYIDDAGSGRLNIRTNDLRIEKYTGETIAKFIADGAVELNYNDVKKLATTSTGIDVTGTVTADGLTVDGTSQFGNSGYLIYNNANPDITLRSVGGTASYGNVILDANGRYGSIQFRTGYDGSAISNEQRMNIATNGDISFYEDTGTTAKFFWDASAESLGIGTSSPTAVSGTTVLEITGTSGNAGAEVIIGSADTSATANDLFGGLAFKSIDSNGTPPHYSGIKARAADTFGGADLEFYAGRSNYESNDPRFVIEGPQSVSGEAMRIDSSGKVGIGTTSPSSSLSAGGLHVTDRIAVGSGSVGTPALHYDGDTDTGLFFGTGVVAVGTGGSERMRIDSSGNVGIGTSSPTNHNPNATTLHVDGGAYASEVRLTNNTTGAGSGNGFHLGSIGTGAYIWQNEVAPLILATSSTERMRIDSSGRVGIGTNSPTYKFEVSDGTRTGIFNPNSTLNGFYIGTAGNHGLYFGTNDGIDMLLETDGDLHVDGNVIAYSTTISDERLKTDIERIDGALDKVCALSGYTFTYKHDGKASAGVVAQEVEKVLPSAVIEKELAFQGDDEAYKIVQYDQLHGLLIEAIKEQQEQINELKALLEAK